MIVLVNQRIGIGTDVHRLAPGRSMRVAGLDWPEEEVGLEGHSDGDVVLHAICDALLSAAGLGDLGSNFGTSDPQWAGAASDDLLAETLGRVRDAGWEVGNVACQLIGNRPRFGPRREEAERGDRRAARHRRLDQRHHDRRARPHGPGRGPGGHRYRTADHVNSA